MKRNNLFAAAAKTFHPAVIPLYIFTLIFLVGPLIYMLVLSFMERDSVWGVRAVFSLRNYARIADPVYLSAFTQSLKLAIQTTLAIAIIGYPFGFFMAGLSHKMRGVVLLLLIIPFWTSALMRLYGWMIVFRANGLLDNLLMALGITKAPLRLLYTYPAVLSGMIYALLPFMIYSVYSSAEKLDAGLVEAARNLGASRAAAFFTVSFPLTLPGLFSGVVLTFVPSMGLFFIADILGGNKTVLVGSVIQEQLTKARDWPFAAALSVVLMLLTGFTLFLYRKITRQKDLEGLI
jgi:spermidine/putrescine transport system permease protein